MQLDHQSQLFGKAVHQVEVEDHQLRQVEVQVHDRVEVQVLRHLHRRLLLLRRSYDREGSAQPANHPGALRSPTVQVPRG